MSETCGKVMGFDYNSFSVYDAILIVSITDRTDGTHGTDGTDRTDRTDGTDGTDGIRSRHGISEIKT